MGTEIQDWRNLTVPGWQCKRLPGLGRGKPQSGDKPSAPIPPSFAGPSAHGAVSRTSWLICLNSGVPDTSHHSNRADSVEVSTTPADSIRRKAVS